MKNLTKIQPEPPIDEVFTKEYLKRLSDKGHILNATSSTDIIRLLIHKVNELTDELNRIKGEE